MAQATEQTSPAADKRHGIEWIAGNHQAFSLLCFGVALALGLASLVVGLVYKLNALPAVIWLAFLAVDVLVAGAWLKLYQGDERDRLESTRVVVLLAGGSAGLCTTFMGIFICWQLWDTLVSWVNGETSQDWTKNLGLMGALVAFISGLALMFASLQLARTEERSNPTLRRLLYGYNAVLSGVLLLVILIVLNVFVYLRLPANVDFTAGSLYTLSTRSQNILKGLEKPTKIYALFTGGDAIGTDVKTLLANCREVNDRIQVESLSPDLEVDKVQELVHRYPFVDREGILIVYGSEPQAEHRFIKREDLFSVPDRFSRTSDDKPNLQFKGEDALMTELNALEEGAKKPIIYFTQGNGELDLKNTDASRVDVGAGLLKELLEKRNFEVKSLDLNPADSKVPDDASLVIVAGPTVPLPDHAVKALKDYLNPGSDKKRGKLIVLLDVVSTPENTMRPTGLEGLLAEYRLQVENQRLLSLPTILNRSPVQVLVRPNPEMVERNPIVAAFQPNDVFTLYNARALRVLPGNNPQSAQFTVDSLFVTLGPVIAESNLRGEVTQIVNEALKNREIFQKKVTEEPLPVVAAVSEMTPPSPGDPHAMLRSGQGKPRLVLFGDASLASNRFMSDRAGRIHFDVLASCIDWLRERPSSIGIEPKKREAYVVSPSLNFWRMTLLPASIMLIGVIGLGTGVWVVRRR
jgi:ABC-type uncharacterized transport system